jgi:hypothetical protein
MNQMNKTTSFKLKQPENKYTNNQQQTPNQRIPANRKLIAYPAELVQLIVPN